MADFSSDQSARESRRDEASRARRAALSAIMVLFLILLILLLIAAATDRTDILRLAEGLFPTTFAVAGFNPILTAPVFAAESQNKTEPAIVVSQASARSSSGLVWRGCHICSTPSFSQRGIRCT